MNQWWLILITQICFTWPWWANEIVLYSDQRGSCVSFSKLRSVKRTEIMLICISIYPTPAQRARDAIITSSLRQHDVADVVLTQWRRYLCAIIALCVCWVRTKKSLKSMSGKKTIKCVFHVVDIMVSKNQRPCWWPSSVKYLVGHIGHLF